VCVAATTASGEKKLNSKIKQWRYKPLDKQLAQSVLAIAGTTATVGGALLLLPNAAVLGAIAYGMAATAMRCRFVVPFLANRELARLVKTGQIAELRDNGLVHNMRAMEAQMRLKPSKGLYVADTNFIAEQDEYGRLSYAAEFLKRLYNGINEEKSVKRIFARAAESEKTMYCALTHFNLVLTTNAAINNYNRDEHNLILAHELTHLKNRDGKTLRAICETFTRETSGALLVLSPALLVSMPVALCGFAVASLAGNLAFKKASRVMERLADRGAIYVTRDIEAAKGVMRRWNQTERPWKIDEALHTHPIGTYRMSSYWASFAEANAYPPLKLGFTKAAGISKFSNSVRSTATPWKVAPCDKSAKITPL